ncbi:hypothetical protein M8J76_005874 [Diaphorina citri]|nr:hypothetical protein M8J75_011589 [Diaphorina citri]KAI5736661.1 hypothetical protein M8J76_005874 [Diaphorina citri]KAI5743320.1 hypothetical protein M8J77_016817 [Diaphorina citri]
MGDIDSSKSSGGSGFKVTSGAIVCIADNSADIERFSGDVVIGTGSVLHPRVYISANGGTVDIGEGNIIEEQVRITNRLKDKGTLVIGNNNVFEVGCIIEAKAIGDNNVFESKCYVGPEVTIGNGVTIGAKCELTAPDTVQDLSVIYGENCDRRLANDKPTSQASQREFLSRILPNYHKLFKPNKPILETAALNSM